MKNKWKINHLNEIVISHLNYKIIYGVSPKEFIGAQAKSIMFAEDTNKNCAAVIFRKKPTQIEMSTVAHEVMHALQYMCQRRNIKMEVELEHMGYLMQYILNEIYGYCFSK